MQASFGCQNFSIRFCYAGYSTEQYIAESLVLGVDNYYYWNASENSQMNLPKEFLAIS